MPHLINMRAENRICCTSSEYSMFVTVMYLYLFINITLLQTTWRNNVKVLCAFCVIVLYNYDLLLYYIAILFHVQNQHGFF